jgi:hypothetical protein
MEQLHGFPLFRLEFDRNGAAVRPAAAAEMIAALKSGAGAGVTDLVAISHGWNNHIAEANDLYGEFFSNARKLWAQAGLEAAGRRLAVAAVYWPSKKFTDAEQIPGGAASFEEETPAERLQSALRNWAEAEADPAWRDALLQCRADVPRLEDDPALQDAWVARLMALLAGEDDDALEAVDVQRQARGREVLQAFAPPLLIQAPDDEPGDATAAVSLPGSADADVAAAGFGNLIGGITGGAAKFFNLFTYYTMKERSGLVAVKGLSPVLKQVARELPALRIHLAGHSFGARLVSAVAREGGVRYRSLSLLQAAFSHFGFSQSVPAIQGRPGHFRSALAHIQGPVLVTHTINDSAVGVAYAVASRTANQIAAGVGDLASRLVGGPNDVYGGLGRNGAQLTPEAVAGKLESAGAAYAFQPGKVYNLQADPFVKGHGDIRNPHVAWAWLNAIKIA